MIFLCIAWFAASALAWVLAAFLAPGAAESAAAALLAPPLALALAFGFRRLLRGALSRHDEAAARREGEELMQDPEFIESLGQYARGEYSTVRPREEKEGEQ